MVLFFPVQQELDCISDDGRILGKIRFDLSKGEYIFYPDSDSVALLGSEESIIAERLVGLASGKFSIPMQDDD